MKKILLSAGIFFMALTPFSAYAICSTPTADAGSMFYNTGQNAMQFCNGTDWYNTGLVVPSATGTSCTTPTGPEGGVYYNTTQNTIQFCNGDDWVNMGTMRFPSATGTACTTPAGPEGGMFFNTTTKTMQFCNGDDWVNATYIQLATNAIIGVEIQKIQASDKLTEDRFGYAVSINNNYAIISAPYEDTGASAAGAIYIYKRAGSVWSESAKLQATDAEANDNFGQSALIHGDYAIVGAPREDTGGSSAGAVYIFKRTGTSWAQEAKIQSTDIEANDGFGVSVSINGDYAIVGAPYEDTGGAAAGAAYIFKRTGTTWAQEAKIQSSDITFSNNFGVSVSIDGDYAVIGANQERSLGSTAGAAYIFKRTGTSWAQEDKIQGSDTNSEDQFGGSVSMSGDYVIVGAIGGGVDGANKGEAYIFKRSGTVWTQEAKIQASDKQHVDYFGLAVSIDNDYAVVGAGYEDTGGSDAGAAYVFKRTGTAWMEESKIQASDKEAGDLFGHAVSINNGTIFVGSRYESTGGLRAGAAYIFD